MKQTTLTEKQKLALDQGRAFTAALDLMKQMDVHAETEADDYIITLACENAEGMYIVQPEGDLQWEIPKEYENLHIEVVVRDRTDLRFIPQLTIHISLIIKNGNEVVSKELPFLWHPFLYHYGANIHIPENGEYTVQVMIDPPLFGRHDENKGKRYDKNVCVEFNNIHLAGGRKEYGPE